MSYVAYMDVSLQPRYYGWSVYKLLISHLFSFLVFFVIVTCEQKLEAADWVSEIQFLAGRTVSETGANSNAASRQHVRKNPYLQHFSLGEKHQPQLQTNTSELPFLFHNQDDKRKLLLAPRLSLDPWWFIWGKQSVVCWVRLDECW